MAEVQTKRIHRFLPWVAPCRDFRLSSLPPRNIRPFLLLDVSERVLWPRLTPARSTAPLGAGCQTSRLIRQASPGRDVVFPSIHPPHLLPAAFDR